MEFRKIGQDPTQSVRNVEEQRIKWAMKNRLEKQYKEYADAGENGVRKFFDSTKKLISRLDHFFTKSKNIEEDKSQSYDSMKKTVRNVFSGLTEDQKIIASFIVYTYGLNFFPFLNDMWCMECIESGEYPNGNGGYPGSNGGYPGNNGGYPGNNGGYPGGNGGSYPGGPYPGNGGGYPGWPNNNAGPYPGNNNNNNGGYPGGNGGFLGGNGNFPGGNGGFPGHNGGYPGNNGGYPGGNGWFPGSGGYPGNGDRLPNTNGGRRPSFGNGNSYGRK
ncbi:hypothetical protein ANCCAN_05642 [Ancylostoma caninum]|uniref:SXP/RAL-2 family protein Ani s 5-like cation-binding domain-containing protein n=1 Tax=Ancylostoma caninum TaxID=29170 RepID=A0A368GVF5_ANCCA|nr:hypothetical protein ANCCAN_05642 [Ancylostoma caninum]